MFSSSTHGRALKQYHEQPLNPRPVKTVYPRTLKPLVPPPTAALLHLPSLPDCAKARFETNNLKSEDISRLFDLSTHIIPAAYPRLTPLIPFSKVECDAGGFAGGETKHARIKRAAAISERLLQLRNDWAAGSIPLDGSENRLLWNVINRYSRRDSSAVDRSPNSKVVTLLLAHATGMPKETWEPFLTQICAKLEGQNVFVDEAWAIESVQHGDSFLVNQNDLGVLFDWSEHARDILNFLQNYLPDRSSSVHAGEVHLPRISAQKIRDRNIYGFRDRLVVTIGHSFSGCASILAAVNSPRLFSGLVLIDPVIVGEFKDRTQQVLFYAGMSLQRQESWSSREEALQLLKRSPVIAGWNPEVIKNYVKYGLVESYKTKCEGRVHLKTPGLQEAVVFVDIQASYEAYEVLERLDNDVPLLWVLASKNSGLLSPEEEQWQVWRRPSNCSNVCAQSGHLIVQDAPVQLAQEVATFLLSKYLEAKTILGCKL